MGRRAADATADDDDDVADGGASRNGDDQRDDPGPDADGAREDRGTRPEGGLIHALGMTAASAVVWGVAHLSAGRRVAGAFLMTLFAALAGGGIVVALDYRHQLRDILVRRDWLTGITVGIVVLALVWVAIVVRSYQVVRPRGMARGRRVLASGLVLVLAVGVCTPLAWAARSAYTLRDTIGTIFHADGVQARPVDAADPWKDRPRVNILLLGGDGAGDRVGVRTDSMTVASIDTRTGDTVLISLPRNLQRFPMIARLRSRWPYGFTGVGAPGDQGLLNELFQDAEENPSLMPGYGRGRRGPELVKAEISYLIGRHIDYYILVNLFGFADIVDAVGGVKVHIAEDIPYGGPEDGSMPTGVLKAGDRRLTGKQALWYGRSRTASSDFVRMGRQKCLMKAIAEQADPGAVLTRFQQLARAAKKTISTNIPAELLPALIKLSDTMKHGAQVDSLMFVPPRYHVYRPDVTVMRRATAQAIARSEHRSATASATPGMGAGSSAAESTAQPAGSSAAGSTAPPAGWSPEPSASASGRGPAGSSGSAVSSPAAAPAAGGEPTTSTSPTSASSRGGVTSLTAACGG